MAIFYEHIKGLAPNNSAGNDSWFQFIQWQDASSAVKNQNKLPKFISHTQSTTSASSALDYGHFVVSGNIAQTLDGPITLGNTFSMSVPSSHKWTWQTNFSETGLPNTALSLLYDNTRIAGWYNKNNVYIHDFKGYLQPTEGFWGGDDQECVIMPKTIASGIDKWSMEIQGYINTKNNIYFGNTTYSTTMNNSNKIYQDSDANHYSMVLQGHVQANYFNAASDKRLKTNINPLPSTLDFVCKTPLYSFNYTTNNLPSIGVIAQDIQDAQFGNFKPVVTPRNEKDFLSVHESKFVYILWKAIQEQQEEIEALKAEIQALKKTEN